MRVLGPALAIYVATTLALTWPMPAHPRTTIYGQTGEALGRISELREVIDEDASPFWPGTLHDLGAPEGLAIPYPRYVASWGGVLPRYLLARLFGPVAGYDAFVLLGYVLSAAAMFLLARRLSGSALAGLLAGWILAFSAAALRKGQGQVEFVHGWVLVLLVWRLLELRTSPTLRNGLLAGAASLFAVSFDASLLLAAVVVQTAVGIVDLVLARRAGTLRPHAAAQAAAAIPPVVAIAIYGLVDATAAPGTGTVEPAAGLGAIVVLAAALLAAIGLAKVPRSLRGRVALGLAAVALLVLSLDLWARSSSTFTIRPLWVYTVLAAEPPAIAAEYPLRSDEEALDGGKLYQEQHGHPLLDYYAAGSREEARARWLARLDDRRVASRLALLGVRNVVLDPSASSPPLPSSGFSQLVGSDGRVLYRVTARPARSLVWPARGFSLPEGEPGSQFAWMIRATAELDVIGRCRACSGRLRFTVRSFARPRTVSLRLSERTVFEERLGTAPRTFSVRLSFPRRARIRVEVAPGPQSVRKTTGGEDPRSLAVAFEEPHFVPSG